MGNNKVVRKVRVGIVLKKYIDERYIRDRDMVVPLYEGETNEDAIRLWKEDNTDFREDEKRYANIVREVPLDSYDGWELHRK